MTRRSALATLAGAAFVCRGAGAEPFTVFIDLSTDQGWQSVDAATVFSGGQEIRFRVRSATPGYLYLLDETPLGEQNWIYPEPDGLVRRMQPGREQIVPPDGSYRVATQPGYDILYWVVSPVRLSAVPQLPVRPPRRSTSKLLPRCKESILRARGLCVDNDAAGAKPAQSPEAVELSRQIAGAAAAESKANAAESRTPGAAVLTSSGNVVVYEMRLAHK
jgi:hypothetical protein